ncbi:MAG: tetratricopeptide (TPR) repeat protein [Neptuniibacter pectenicola]|jgi:tetratricopeptide (TPR) repeat protein|uniref:tetratricopeptide repeat protein n=1 Tax=Neptuniibacter pectenicola TaxID=1806669 RepID=UPI003AEE209A
MQIFELDIKNKRLRTAISAIISASILTGCGALTQKTAVKSSDTGFCYNGGRTNEYSCDPEKATAQADMRTADIDDEWMNSKLSEIHAWLAEEKENLVNGTPSSTDEANKPPQDYITTVSISTPTPQQTSPEIANILKLSQQGQHKAALSGIDKLIADNPNMAAAKLTKGIITNQMGDKASAKAIFQNLMTTYPDRPEAFNNLAVIYAEEGNFPKAIETLQQAFQTHPSYAQVHSNLKELYATLASQAYSKALDLGSVSTGPELTMIDRVPSDLSGNSADQLLLVSNPTASTPIQLSAAKVEQKPHLPDTTKEPAKAIKVAQATAQVAVVAPPSQNTTVSPKTPIASPSSVVETAGQSQQVSRPVAKALPSDAQDTLEQQVTQHLQNWASAWSNKDHQGYINAYTDVYRPNAKLNHNQWVTQRQQRISKPAFIRVDVSNITIKRLSPNLVEARFEQRYQSDTYKDAVKKRVLMVNTSGQWKISLERSLGLIH